MLNEPTNNHEENDDDSVYHFSDEEYEVSEGASSSEAKGLTKPRASSAKRLAISIAIFFVLVYIVYKIVSPSSSSPDTDIAPVATTEPRGMPVVKSAAKDAVQPKMAAAPVMPVITPPSGVVAPQPLQSSQPAQVAAQPEQAAAKPAQTIVASTPQQPSQLAQQAPVQLPQQPLQPAQGIVANQQPVQQQPTPVAPQPVAQPAVQQPQQPQSVATTQPTPPLFQPEQVNAQPAQSMPTEQLPAQQPAQNIVSTTPTVDMQQVVGALSNQVTGGVNAQTAKLASDTENLNNQLQTEYVQRLNDYGMQNKILLNQIETLSAKVATMETQLNQLVQALTRAQNQQNTTSNNNSGNNSNGISMSQENGGAKPSLAAAEPRSNYNVQAIIPGRAWLKSENGETLTVAEGDAIQSLGRVTKIDPYDGVVEINTGNKMISLSYGSA
ncbi:MAG TPA: hypothetical protein VNC84_08065 [Gammaproteobacteria bacterium]|jgi:hypothetical protein|nr:hypothetical protein [Gammaproteobacteria bacterium]